jgi:hypothetical protein
MRVTDKTSSTADLQSAVDSAARVVGRESLGNVYVRGALPCVTLRVRDSGGQWARRTATGRRTTGASWDAHRVFLDVLFALRPNARVRTSLATYKGAADYIACHRATYCHPVRHGGQTAEFGTL